MQNEKIEMLELEKTILVTGAHRSGSTFVGTMLSTPLSVGYVHEPFNMNHGMEGVDEWFPYVTTATENSHHYRSLVNRLSRGNARFKEPKNEPRSVKAAVLRSLVGSKSLLHYRMACSNPLLGATILKDPLACLSAEWLHREFGLKTLLLVRHPAAFVGSLLRMKWRFDLSDLSSRTALMEDHLHGILEQGRSYANLSPIEEGVLLWRCIYKVIFTYADRNNEMIIRTHEEISKDPVEAFCELYNRFGLPFTRRTIRIILERTSSRNPIDPRLGQLHTMSRDSAKNIKRWTKIFDKDDIRFIRDSTEEFASRFYSDRDW